ncbi:MULTISPECIES: hypothetical protein [unclassified Paenibacillus]|uniref:hypothetical protein n=1 Tax=unclassified Paenibacillus TaxID=185978 RepID=UPI003636DB3C
MQNRLYHYTSYSNRETIMKEGLRVPSQQTKKSFSSSDEINSVLAEYRPNDIPSFIKRDDCIFLHPKPADYRITSADDIIVSVDQVNLNLNGLYVCDYNYADRIWGDVVDGPYSGIYSGIPLKESAEAYWRSLIPYLQYQSEYFSGRPEVLYFDSIPPEMLLIENDQLRPELKVWMDEFADLYGMEVVSANCFNAKIGEYHTNIHYYPDTQKLHIITTPESKLFLPFIKRVTNSISFKSMKSGGNGFYAYSNVVFLP